MSKQVTPWSGWHEDDSVKGLSVWGFWIDGDLRGEVTHMGDRTYLSQVLTPSGDMIKERLLPSLPAAKTFVRDYYTDPIDGLIDKR